MNFLYRVEDQQLWGGFDSDIYETVFFSQIMVLSTELLWKVLNSSMFEEKIRKMVLRFYNDFYIPYISQEKEWQISTSTQHTKCLRSHTWFAFYFIIFLTFSNLSKTSN